MKLSFSQLFLFLFIILNYFQCQNCVLGCVNQNKIFKNLYNAVNRTLSSFLYPVCYKILLNKNNIQAQYISSKGLTGRVMPVGTFTTKVLALEYLYGITCPRPNLPPIQDTLLAVDLVSINYNSKYLRVQGEFILNLTGNKRVTFFVGAAYDKNYKLCGYEGQVRNLGLTLDTYTDEEHKQSIYIICNVTQTYCKGTLKQYESVNDCIKFLTEKVPYGSYDRGDQGNVVCRLIHANLVSLTPSVHCPHVGPTGGGACINKTANSYYNQNDFLACAHRYN